MRDLLLLIYISGSLINIFIVKVYKQTLFGYKDVIYNPVQH